jgi:hypothetical protein
VSASGFSSGTQPPRREFGRLRYATKSARALTRGALKAALLIASSRPNECAETHEQIQRQLETQRCTIQSEQQRAHKRKYSDTHIQTDRPQARSTCCTHTHSPSRSHHSPLTVDAVTLVTTDATHRRIAAHGCPHYSTLDTSRFRFIVTGGNGKTKHSTPSDMAKRASQWGRRRARLQ